MRRRSLGSAAEPLRTLFRSGAIGGLDDGELLERFRLRRDAGAFEAIVRRHGPMVRRVCRSILADDHDAGDAYQATFLILAKRPGAIRRGGSLASWLFGVSRRVALKARADARRRRSHERGAAALRGIEAAPSPELLPEVMEEVARLPDRLRVPVVLCYLQGQSYEAAARALGCPVRTVQSRLRTARDRLRVRLTRRGLAPSLATAGGLAARSAEGAGAFASGATSAGALAKSAVGFSSGKGAVAGTVSASVLSLVNGGMKAMMIEKVTLAAAGFLVLGGTLGFGTVVAHIGVGQEGEAAPETPSLADDDVVPGRDGPGPKPLGPMPAVAEVMADSPSPLAEPTSGDREPSQEPALDLFRGIPRPWETVVRITVKDGDTIGFGTGTVIRSTPAESIILTCAHIFSVKGSQPTPDAYRVPVLVGLFDGTLGDPGGQTVRPLDRPIGAEVIDYDFPRDVALIRIRPGRVLKASPIAPFGWEAKKGMRMITMGCSHGEDATAWSTSVTEPVFRYKGPGNREFRGIICRFSPKQGRSGGGLFTEEGYLAGVSNFRFGSEIDAGLYAHPETIWHLLERNGIGYLRSWEARIPADEIEDESDSIRHPEPKVIAPSPPDARGDDDRLRRIEQRLDELSGAIAEGRTSAAETTIDNGSPVDFESYRPKLLAMLEAGPVRLNLIGPVEASLLLRTAEDVEPAAPILRAMFAQGRPMTIERLPGDRLAEPELNRDNLMDDPMLNP